MLERRHVCLCLHWRSRVDMIVLKVFLFLQGLLLAARCEVWPRDQELKDGEDEQLNQHQSGWDHGNPYKHFGTGHDRAGTQKQGPVVSETIHYPLEHRHSNPKHGSPSEDVSVDAEGGSADINIHPTRTGNWCTFVHKRVVTKPVACGTEKYVIKSQSPCPNRTPDCHLIMYKLSTRLVYKEKQMIHTALLWRCCPGHAGDTCEDTVENGHVPESGDSQLGDTGNEWITHKKQNDHQKTKRSLIESLMSEEKQTDKQHRQDYPPSSHTGHEPHYEKAHYSVDNGHGGSPTEKHHPNSGLVPIHYLKDVMMSHLQPIFDSFNLTLARLSEEVQDLQRDMTQLQLDQMLQGESKTAGSGIGEELKQHEAKTETLQQVEELTMQLDLQRDEMEEKLHAQQAMLHYNLTNLKAGMDVQHKRNQKMLQTSLHSMNSSLSEVKDKQEQLEEEFQRVLRLVSQMPSPERQPQEDTAVWEAINRLDNKVVNNTVQLSILNEDHVRATRTIEQLQTGWKALEERVTKNDRKNEDRYIEAFLEVDAAKEAVGKSTDELSNNVTLLQSTVQELEEDLDHLFIQFSKNISIGSRDCDCSGLSKSVGHLKLAVANISVIANENRLALDSAAEERVNIWENGGWGQPVEEIKLGLHSVQNLLALEQEKRRTLQQTLRTLQTSVLSSQTDIEALQQQDSQKSGEIKHLFNSFSSLLQDAIRHSSVLEVLLGEEVLEFTEWSSQVQKAHSIPTLKMMISDLQEQINKHSQSLASMLNSEDPTAGEPSELADWIAEDLKRRQKEQKSEHFSGNPSGYKDFLALEKAVEQLKAQVIKLRDQQCLSCCDCTKDTTSKGVEEKLQAELSSVHKSLDDHLRLFSRIFSNTDGLSASEATVNLDHLLALMKKKEAKLQRKKQKKRAERQHSAQRSKRDTSLQTAVHNKLLENTLMFAVSSRDGVNTPGTVVFKSTSINHGQTYSPETGMFRAPTTGVYLFVLTLDFGPGPSLAQLKRGEKVAASVYQNMREPSEPVTRHCLIHLQQGEEIHLELMQGTLKQENTFTGLLLQQTT
ncbi:multimerin-2a isoform X2 [Tachysurus vachellii]|uniref:multimerin-2a isoform X2 n=1 Tax=Tachysurus vachellii TaxID=175792 RepID=UPI00296AEA83|nr:multimerin-2a isoform X2 [Tachysurus vachellii]